MHASRIFDPNAGNATLVATVSDRERWMAELRDFEAEKNERDIKRLMNQRTGVCG